MKVLFIGDIFAEPGRIVAKNLLPELRASHHPDFIIANAENAAGGNGLTPKIAEDLFSYGIDALTSGNHIWDKKEAYDLLNRDNRILRPLNFPPASPGKGYHVFTAHNGDKIAVVNLCGRILMEPVDCPFRGFDSIYPLLRQETRCIVLDFHAEATSEKRALGFYLDGRLSALLGTHTHVQTADEAILPNGTGYISDVGMTGPHLSAIGIQYEIAIKRFLTRLPIRYEPATGDCAVAAVLLELDTTSGKCLKIERIFAREHSTEGTHV